MLHHKIGGRFFSRPGGVDINYDKFSISPVQGGSWYNLGRNLYQLPEG